MLQQASRAGAEWNWTSHPWNQSGISVEKREQTGRYVQSLLEAAYPAGDSLEMEMTHRGFATYLSESKFSAEELLGQIQDLHLVQVKQEGLEAGKKKVRFLLLRMIPKKSRGLF